MFQTKEVDLKQINGFRIFKKIVFSRKHRKTKINKDALPDDRFYTKFVVPSLTIFPVKP